ncbi:N2,N2-dimethylguanosine tRNA methyltransferase [Giardia duodenalis]|uniref:N2,N2-dimethylguanosine tRNA methyltransferase n=1 Tax=Giardia intestinalis TaxID=5741 RepID=V6TFF0_GIAIN|nr:N2,N2-dimethylguanosine tRNA methyltransferase [Giardia intestinalis]
MALGLLLHTSLHQKINVIESHSRDMQGSRVTGLCTVSTASSGKTYC